MVSNRLVSLVIQIEMLF